MAQIHAADPSTGLHDNTGPVTETSWQFFFGPITLSGELPGFRPCRNHKCKLLSKTFCMAMKYKVKSVLGTVAVEAILTLVELSLPWWIPQYRILYLPRGTLSYDLLPVPISKTLKTRQMFICAFLEKLTYQEEISLNINPTVGFIMTRG